MQQSRDPKQLTAEYSVIVRLSLKLNILLFTFVYNSHVTHGNCQLSNQLMVGLSLRLNILLKYSFHQSSELHGVRRKDCLPVSLQCKDLNCKNFILIN
jgi:hypothetical protein